MPYPFWLKGVSSALPPAAAGGRGAPLASLRSFLKLGGGPAGVVAACPILCLAMSFTLDLHSVDCYVVGGDVGCDYAADDGAPRT